MSSDERGAAGPARPAAARRRGWGGLSAYGAMALPLSIAETPILLYLPAFYAQKLHLDAGLVGLVFLIARLWDGLSDLFIAWASDRTRSRFGRRKPWVVIGTPVLVVSTWFLCNPPRDAGLAYLFIWAVVFYLGFTGVKIPHISWGTELETDYVERSRVTSCRETFTMLGNVLFVAAPLILFGSNAQLDEILLLIAVTVAVTAPLSAVAAGMFLRDPLPRETSAVSLRSTLTPILTDKVLRTFLIATLFIWISSGMLNSLIVFALGVGLGLPDGLLWIILVVYIGTLCAVPAMMALARRVDKHVMLTVGLTGTCIFGVALAFVPHGDFPMVVALWAVGGFFGAANLVLPTSMLADMIDQGEIATGERRAGPYVALYNLACKLGLAFGVGIAFMLLDVIGYDPAATAYSAADVQNIRWMGFVVPFLVLVPAIALLARYPITRTVQARLRQALSDRQG